ncbi:neuroligin, partial [Rhyzopertha dominica]
MIVKQNQWHLRDSHSLYRMQLYMPVSINECLSPRLSSPRTAMIIILVADGKLIRYLRSSRAVNVEKCPGAPTVMVLKRIDVRKTCECRSGSLAFIVPKKFSRPSCACLCVLRVFRAGPKLSAMCELSTREFAAMGLYRRYRDDWNGKWPIPENSKGDASTVDDIQIMLSRCAVKRPFPLSLLLLLILPHTIKGGPRYSSRIVEIQTGAIRGIILELNSRHLEPVEVFRGVPYAAPPVGPLRFQPPQPPLPWPGTRLADTFGAVCPQRFPDITNRTAALQHMPKGRYNYLKKLVPHLVNQSEDCLFLNIYVPGSDRNGIIVLVDIDDLKKSWVSPSEQQDPFGIALLPDELDNNKNTLENENQAKSVNDQ